MSQRRKVRRSQAKSVRPSFTRGRPPSVELQLIHVASESLKLTEKEHLLCFDVINQRPSNYDSGRADRLLARIVELAELTGVPAFLDREVSQIRAEVIQRQGETFFEEVAGSGMLASKAASRIVFASELFQ